MLFTSETASPVAKSALVGIAATFGAAVENDWKVLAVGAAVQLGMAAITALAAHYGRSYPSRGTRRRKTTAIPAAGNTKAK